MKLRILGTVLIVAPILAVLGLTVAANSLEDIRALGEIRLGNSADYAPFYFKQNGKLTGFEVELGNALAAKLGVTPSWRTVEFNSLLVTVQQDRLDAAIASHTITAERAKIVDFSTPHYCTGTVIVSRKGGPLNPEELKNKVVAVSSSSTFSAYARGLSGLRGILSFAKEDDALESLRKSQADAYLTDRLFAVAAVKKYPNPSLQISKLLTTERIAIAVRKGNASLLKGINDALAQTLNDGTYEKLSQKYFGTDIRCQ
jgi:polar amino acid transport system substrate-binding protein